MKPEIVKIQTLVAEGKTEEALLLASGSNDDVILLQSRYASGKKQYNMGIIDFGEWARIQNQVNFALLEISENTSKKEVDKSTSKKTEKITEKELLTVEGNKYKAKVYITYSHADFEAVRDIKTYLVLQGIKVEIDVESMLPGDDIRKYTQEQIDNADFILLVVSRNSLRSGWIASDINYARKINAKILPVRLDTAAFDTNYLVDALQEINSKIEEHDTQIKKRQQLNVQFSDIEENKKRLLDLKYSLPNTIQFLHSTLVVDISESQFEEGMSKVIMTILKSKKVENIVDNINEGATASAIYVPDKVVNPKPTNPNSIYFSYAWGDEFEDGDGESREKVVDDLYDSLLDEGYSLKRDKMDLGYKGLISEFMKEIGEGTLIIVAISDKYLKSPYCMFELYEVWRNNSFDKDKFTKKIFPLIIERIKLNDPMILEQYFEYWEQQEESWKNLVQKRADKIGKEHFETYERVKQISRSFSNLASFIHDMNSLTKKIITENDFQVIKESINKAIEEI